MNKNPEMHKLFLTKLTKRILYERKQIYIK